MNNGTWFPADGQARVGDSARQVATLISTSILASISMLAGLVAVALPAGAEELVVVITAPAAGEVLFGEVDVAFEVFGRSPQEIARAEVFVDDHFVAALSAPPWALRHDVGDDNVTHRFEVVVQARDGARASALLVSREFRVDLEVEAPLQQLYVTVEKRGERMRDLRRDEFEVHDDGERQAIVTFERGDVPLVAVLLVDASNSMAGEPLRAATAGAVAFVDQLDELDQAQLVLFSDHVVHQTPFTNFADVLRTGLLTVEAAGGTALDDHLYLALERLETRQGRRAVILLSDGLDVSSLLDMDDVLATARRSQALVYWLRLGGPRSRFGSIYTAWQGPPDHRRELDLLDEVIETSGGRIVDLGSVEEAAAAFDAILRELRDQYVIGFYPSRNRDDGAWHEVEVQVERRGLEVRHRAGYVDQ